MLLSSRQGYPSPLLVDINGRCRDFQAPLGRCSQSFYSSRELVIGSIREALRAGRYPAIAAAIVRIAAAILNVRGSSACKHIEEACYEPRRR